MAWMGLSWVVCSAATFDLVGWPAVIAMFAGAVVIGDE